MLADATPVQSRAVTSIAQRFWLLLTAILVLAIVSSILALRFVSVPFLTDYQNRAVVEQAQKAAKHLDESFGRKQLLLEFVANDPDVFSIAMGYSENASYFPDLLASLPTPESLSWLTFYDALGDEVARFDPRAEERAIFAPEQVTALLSQAIEGQWSQRAPSLVATKDGVTYLVMATRVIHSGLVEGAFLAGHRIVLDSLFPANQTTRETTLLSSSSAEQAAGDAELAPLSEFALTLAIAPDVSSIKAAGTRLITHSVAAIASVLVAAFAVFALLGRAVIVAPHRRLEDQAFRLELQKRELAELAAVAERANDAVSVMDLDGNLIWANPAFERLTGRQMTDLQGLKPGAVLQGEDTDPDTVTRLEDARVERKAIKVEILNYTIEGQPYWISLSLSPLENDLGEAYGFVAISNDISAARKNHEALIAAKKEIEHQALHDALTGLPNRRALDKKLQERAQIPDCETTLVRIDLDHFKYVNDTMGHEAGDYVLTVVAEILRSETRPADLAARVGGDEFVLLLGPDATELDGQKTAERILDQIKSPKQYKNKTIRVGASFGVAGLGGGLLEREHLAIGADAALYEAKEAGRNRVHLYTPVLHEAVLERRELARELRLAVGRDEFVPFFQPQFDAHTFEIIGVETLARWQSPSFGHVAPGRFLPVAEQLSIVEEIDDQICRKAIAQISSLRAEGISVPKLSLNVTAHRIQDRAVHDVIRNIPEDAPVIAFEVLESVLVEEQSASFLFGLDLLRDLGVEIEIDDFGSGHASIVGLMQLRPDAMKIDQRLVLPILDDPLSRGILEKIVSMAEFLDLTVVAEGVETMQHARVLAEIGCHVLQGFAFCKPMALEDLRIYMSPSQTLLRDRLSGAN